MLPPAWRPSPCFIPPLLSSAVSTLPSFGGGVLPIGALHCPLRHHLTSPLWQRGPPACLH
uniref:Uncharacterized protein n=1 Tax=Arundo donax TaxID=35708 RepID=A0A0A9C1C9_ARUDO